MKKGGAPSWLVHDEHDVLDLCLFYPHQTFLVSALTSSFYYWCQY